MSDYDIPPSLRYPRTPPPRDIGVIAEEHHCAPGCIHMREAWKRGAEAGARAERECVERHVSGVAGMAAVALLNGLALLTLAALVWMTRG